MEQLKVRSKNVRITLNVNEMPSATQRVRSLLNAYPLNLISQDFGVFDMELTELALVPLLQAVDYIWDLTGTQIILEDQVWSRNYFPVEGIKFKIASLFHRIILTQKKVADLNRMLGYLREALGDRSVPPNRENLAILSSLIGCIYVSKARANHIARQYKTVKPLATDAVAALQLAMEIWNDDKFQALCQSNLTAAYIYLGKRGSALKNWGEVLQFTATFGIDSRAELNKAGWDLTLIERFLGK